MNVVDSSGWLEYLVVDLDRATALEAAWLSLLHGIAMADSVMLSTAQRHAATLWTQDSAFDGLPGARYIPRN
jgi:predicted nucleic acid-binding protein